MHDLILALAKYNRGANLNLISVLENAGPATLAAETGTFYKTFTGTLQHCFWYELSWLRRYKALGDYPSFKAPVLDKDIDALKAEVGDDFAKLSKLMQEVDALYVSFAEEVSAEDLRRPIKFKNFKGEEQERLVWQTIFHVLNHFTHHRGELSGALDRMGVSNDFAGFFRYL